MAPILSFTSEEIWQVLTKNPQDSVMLHTWHVLPKPDEEGELLAKWSQLREIRADVAKALEEVRIEGRIGSSLQAEVTLQASGERYDLLARLGDDLKFVFIVSKTSVVQGEDRLQVEPSPHNKCERCWHVRDDVGLNAEHPDLCGRCVSNLYGEGEDRRYA